tara:strand:- start:267 stop:593 length:327 start_codon:yes stop_codon:yes gene_type:complete
MVKSNYIKSPQKVSTFIPKILKPFRNKIGIKALELRTNWEKIVGKEIAEKCDVCGLKTFNNKKILILVSDENNLVELSYSSNLILERIHGFNSEFKIEGIKFKKSLQK